MLLAPPLGILGAYAVALPRGRAATVRGVGLAFALRINGVQPIVGWTASQLPSGVGAVSVSSIERHCVPCAPGGLVAGALVGVLYRLT